MTERKDIVERMARLRELAANLANCHRYTLYREPAKRVSDDLRAILTALEASGLERLQAENAALREALEDIAALRPATTGNELATYRRNRARAALESPSA